jgi:hypothetical protein
MENKSFWRAHANQDASNATFSPIVKDLPWLTDYNKSQALAFDDNTLEKCLKTCLAEKAPRDRPFMFISLCADDYASRGIKPNWRLHYKYAEANGLKPEPANTPSAHKPQGAKEWCDEQKHTLNFEEEAAKFDRDVAPIWKKLPHMFPQINPFNGKPL